MSIPVSSPSPAYPLSPFFFTCLESWKAPVHLSNFALSQGRGEMLRLPIASPGGREFLMNNRKGEELEPLIQICFKTKPGEGERLHVSQHTHVGARTHAHAPAPSPGERGRVLRQQLAMLAPRKQRICLAVSCKHKCISLLGTSSYSKQICQLTSSLRCTQDTGDLLRPAQEK